MRRWDTSCVATSKVRCSKAPLLHRRQVQNTVCYDSKTFIVWSTSSEHGDHQDLAILLHLCRVLPRLCRTPLNMKQQHLSSDAGKKAIISAFHYKVTVDVKAAEQPADSLVSKATDTSRQNDSQNLARQVAFYATRLSDLSFSDAQPGWYLPALGLFWWRAR
jgi:hypothetical protein